MIFYIKEKKDTMMEYYLIINATFVVISGMILWLSYLLDREERGGKMNQKKNLITILFFLLIIIILFFLPVILLLYTFILEQTSLIGKIFPLIPIIFPQEQSNKKFH